jgi:hypothetical protein
MHCDGCGGHGGAAGGLAFAALLVIAIAAGIRARGHAIARGLEITGYVLIGIAAAGFLAAAVYGALRVRRRVLETRDRRISPRVRAVITDVKAGRPAFGQIEPPYQEAEGWPHVDGWPLPGQWAQIRPRIGRDQ